MQILIFSFSFKEDNEIKAVIDSSEWGNFFFVERKLCKYCFLFLGPKKIGDGFV